MALCRISALGLRAVCRYKHHAIRIPWKLCLLALAGCLLYCATKNTLACVIAVVCDHIKHEAHWESINRPRRCLSSCLCSKYNQG